MYRLILLNVAVILLFTIPAFTQTGASLTLPINVNASPQDSITVPMTLTTDSLISGAQIVIDFDSTKLKFVDVLPGKDIMGIVVTADTALNFPPSIPGKNDNVKFTISVPDTNLFSGQNLELMQIIWYISGFNSAATIYFDRGTDRTFLFSTRADTIRGNEIRFTNGVIGIIQDTTAMLSMTTDTTDIIEGNSFAVNIDISEVNDLNNFSLDIWYDPSHIAVDSVREGGFLNNSAQDATNWRQPKIDNLAGLVENINCTRTDTIGVFGAGTLATIYFRALMAGSSPVQFVPDQCRLNYAPENSIPVKDFQDLSINIYRQPAVELALPDTVAAANRVIDLPLVITEVANFDIISALIAVQFDSSCVQSVDVISQATLTENWQPPVVNNRGTSLYFALAGSSPLAGDGILVYLRFFSNPLAGENDQCDLQFIEVMLNEGNPTTINHDGHFRIRGFQVAGTVKYQGTGIPIQNAEVLISGQQTLSRFTDLNGNYSFNGLHYGNIMLTSHKSGGQGRSITPFDAALLLQYVVGNSQLTPYQLIAADVSGDSTISAFDAALIMRYSVRLENKFPVMTDSLDCWDFVPTSYPINDTNWVAHPNSLYYQPLEQDKFNQNFIGVIYGDVSQNWISPAMQSIEAEKSELIARLELGNSPIVQNGIIEVPILIEHTNTISSAEIELEFDNKKLNIISVVATGLSKKFLINYNSNNGKLKIALAGAKPITGSGSLVRLRFQSKHPGKVNFDHPLKLNQAWLNDQPIQSSITTAITKNLSIPGRLELSPNYPNPFNQETIFQVSIPGLLDNKILLVIYNLKGQVVRTLMDGILAPGEYSICWNGTDDNGTSITSGEYFCILKARGERIVRKFILLR